MFYTRIPLEERPEVLVLVKEKIHLRNMWGEDKPPRSYYQVSSWYGEVVDFA